MIRSLVSEWYYRLTVLVRRIHTPVLWLPNIFILSGQGREGMNALPEEKPKAEIPCVISRYPQTDDKTAYEGLVTFRVVYAMDNEHINKDGGEKDCVDRIMNDMHNYIVDLHSKRGEWQFFLKKGDGWEGGNSE